MTGPEAFMQALGRYMAEACGRPCVVVKADERDEWPPTGARCSAAQLFGIVNEQPRKNGAAEHGNEAIGGH